MTTTAKIGAFTLVVLVLLAVLVMRIEDIHIGKKARTNTADVHFKDVAGLDDKSAVRIAGVRVGKVDGIQLLPDGTALARVSLDRDVELHQGARGEIKNLGLLGDKYVELTPGDVHAPRLADGALIEGTQPTGFDQLTKLAEDIGKDVKSLTGALSNSLGGKQGEERLNRIVDNIGLMAEELRKMVEANRQNVDLTLANLRQFSGEIRETLARVDRILDENRQGVKSTVGNIDTITGKLQTTADNLNSITGKIDTGQGTIGKLLNDDETHKNLNEALQSVKSGVESLNTTLTRINRIQLDLGFRGEFNTRGSNSKGYFTLDVVPRENKFYRLEVSSQPGGQRNDTTVTTTITNPDGTKSTYHTETTAYEDKFGFSLELGYRFRNTVLRAGLIESRGGAAVDQLFLKDRLSLSAEGWDFGRNHQSGHVKVYGKYKTGGSMYFVGGVDELLNSDVRSAFVGAGLSWKDEDIKTLFGALPFLK